VIHSLILALPAVDQQGSCACSASGQARGTGEARDGGGELWGFGAGDAARRLLTGALLLGL